MSDPREAIALLRYRMVAAATDPRLRPAERGRLLPELAAQAYHRPTGQPIVQQATGPGVA